MESFLASERERVLALRVCTRLREWAALSGPGAAASLTSAQLTAIRHAPTGSGTALGSLGGHYTWRQAAAAVESGWIRRRTNPNDWLYDARGSGAQSSLCCTPSEGGRRGGAGESRRSNEKAQRTWRRWAHAVDRCPDPLTAQRKLQTATARLAREAKARRAERDAAHFQMVMGVEGEGNITLAPGLEDVSVAFRRRRRVNWRPTGRRNRRGGRRTDAKSGGSDVDGESSGSDERESDSDLESGGDDDDGGAGDADSDFEVEAGDDGNSGKGNEHGVMVGDTLRVWWVAEQVWFRCRVEAMGGEGRTVRVAYLIDDRWGTFVHALADVEWERWAPGGRIDPAEADYDMDVWVPEEEVDREAAAAAAEGSRRRGVSRGDGGETASREPAESTLPRAGGGDESEAEEDVEGARAAWDGGATSSSTTYAPVSQFG